MTPASPVAQLHDTIDRLLAVHPAVLSVDELQSLVVGVQAERARLTLAAGGVLTGWERFLVDEQELVEACALLRLFDDCRRLLAYWAQRVDDELIHSELSRLMRDIRSDDTAKGIVRSKAQLRAAALVRMAWHRDLQGQQTHLHRRAPRSHQGARSLLPASFRVSHTGLRWPHRPLPARITRRRDQPVQRPRRMRPPQPTRPPPIRSRRHTRPARTRHPLPRRPSPPNPLASAQRICVSVTSPNHPRGDHNF